MGDRKTAAKTKKKTNVIPFRKIPKIEYVEIADDRSSAIVELYIAINDGKQDLDSLTLRRATLDDSIEARDMKGGDQTFKFALNRISLLAGVSSDTLSQIDEAIDSAVLIEAYEALRGLPDFNEAKDNFMLIPADDFTSVKIKLCHPIDSFDKYGDDITINELTLKRSQIKHSEEAVRKSTNDYLQDAYKYATLCGVSVEVIKQIDFLDDYASLVQAFEFFLERRPRRAKS